MTAPLSLSGFEGQDLRTLIDRQATRRKHAPFLVWEPFDGDTAHWTYREFCDLVRTAAAGLVERGIRPGDRVLIHLDNCPEFLTLWLGCAYAGAVAVTTNTRSTPDDIAYFAEHSHAVAAFTEPGFYDAVAKALPPDAWTEVVIPGGGLAISGDPASLPERPHDPLAPFGIQYTSGTTARPKAVLWSHANALWGARVSAMHEALLPDDVHLVFLPLFHTNAQVYSVLASLWAGASVVLQPRFSVSRFWDVAVRNACTWTSVVPFCTMALLDRPIPEKHSFKFFGAAVLLPAVEERFGVKTVTWWGMTETVTHGIVGSPTYPPSPMGMGFASPCYEILVLDETMQPVAPGEAGNLYVRGRRGLSLFVEYVDDPEATLAAFTSDGLFITGDRVRLGTDGTMFFVERAKDMLKVGGENVAASEIERVIAGVPGVREVAVAGKPHPMLDEVPIAFVIASEFSENLVGRISAACALSLASFKRPVDIRLVDDFPRSTLNKVSKALLREKLRREG
ncbi:AMP-binding protein [Sphingomonas sp. SUN039]|uniref:AMP-binding protein n=1 Tax=Sphingomonas sp. SUN039 TaxID=2937787 RepID=UPI002164C2FD|nr:AMP-binding protein [Sphingomonas sp. SUN039]UVO53765.1 AMP-binding protein [Sphingomonas sp. SUN039]